VFRSKVTRASYERRAETVLHEMAHMWFGDLVTMRWWDDLWLNESFASYMSVLCQAEATPWPQAWTTFANAEKSWAYRQDALPSTHPISADIRDLEDVEVNFDGITYAKGAAVLKQLVAWVGREAFFAGLRSYFADFAWSNATLADLLGHLEATSGRDLSSWAKDWLQTAGTNTMQAEFTTDEQDRFTSFDLRQTAPADHPTLRPHRLAIGLYDMVDGHLQRTDRVELDVTGELTPVPQLIGRPRPALVLVNDDDLAVVKVRLDPQSLATATSSIGAFTESLPRTLCWAAAWDMTRDAQMRARDFISLVLGGIAAETDSTVVLYLLRQLATAAHLYTAPADREQILQQVAERLEQLAREAPPGSDHQLQYVRALTGFARTPAQLDLLAGLLSGAQSLPGLVVDTDLRWTLLHRLVAMGRAGDAQIDAELARDDTAAGRRQAAAARAARPTPQAKAEAWASVVDRDDLPNATQAAVIGGFMQADQAELLTPYVDRYFAAIKQVWASRTNEIAQNIVVGLYPTVLASPALLERTDA
jgi:aminopeptidase N